MALDKTEEWRDLSYKGFSDVLRSFPERQKLLENIVVRVKGGENSLTAKTLLRYYQAARSVDTSAALCGELFAGKEISFVLTGEGEDKEVHHFVFGGGDITDKFDSKPWLLDMLFDMAQGLLAKKLMPPSLGSMKRDRGSDVSTQEPETPAQS